MAVTERNITLDDGRMVQVFVIEEHAKPVYVRIYGKKGALSCYFELDRSRAMALSMVLANAALPPKGEPHA